PERVARFGPSNERSVKRSSLGCQHPRESRSSGRQMIQAQLSPPVLAERRVWIIWGVIFALALTLRFALLDLAPLDSIEAGLVLPSCQAAQALPVDESVGLQSPLFTSLTR